MKRFLKLILLYSCIILALFAAAEIYVERLPNPAKDKHQWMKKHSKEVTTLVLGNSHTFYGISPRLLGERAFSLAQVSQTYRYDDYLLQHYEMPQLKHVILPYSYMSLWEDFESQEDKRFNAIRYRVYMDVDLHPRWSRYGLECLSLPSFKEKLKSIFLPSQLSWDSLGWGDHYKGHRFEEWDNGEERVKENTYHNTSVVSLNMKYLNDILHFCQEKHIQVILLTMPVSGGYYIHEDKAQRLVNRIKLDQILEQHPEVNYVDLEQDLRFTDDDFYDADHLNTNGARKCTAIIREILN